MFFCFAFHFSFISLASPPKPLACASPFFSEFHTMNVTSDFHPAMLCHAYAMPSFYAVRPPMGPTDTPSSLTNWGIFPTRSAAESYAATLASVPNAPTDAVGADGPETPSTIESFADAMSAIVYASRGTVVIGSGQKKSKKKKRKKRDGESVESGFTAVYKGGAGGGTWTWTLLS